MGRSDDTRRRLLDAAQNEFAAYGIAGGRVDRIAAKAGCNKQSIYTYFGNKDGLFEAAFNDVVSQNISIVEIDAYDLPNYACRLFEWYRNSPNLARLVSWYHLERAATEPLPIYGAKLMAKAVQDVRAAQRDGLVAVDVDAQHLLAFVLRSAMVGAMGPSEWKAPGAQSDALRDSLFKTVQRMVRP